MGTLPEWLTGSPAKRLCIARVSSNLTGVDFAVFLWFAFCADGHRLFPLRKDGTGNR
jgi:hypothetical protein